MINDPPPSLRDLAPHVPQALNSRVMRAMEKNPADRYESAAAFDSALGSLLRHDRYWWRSDQHLAAGHAACWTGTSPGRSDATVCAVPVGKRFEVVAEHHPSRRRINAACRSAAPPSALSRNLRAAMAAVP